MPKFLSKQKKKIIPSEDTSATQAALPIAVKEEVIIVPKSEPIATATTTTDLSTITVNDKTLPLNTSEDLERAASLLMQQRIDMEDSEVEFIAAKAEPLDGSQYDRIDYTHDNLEYTLSADVLPNQYDNWDLMTSPYEEQDFFSYYLPPTSQYDFNALPPINTVKSALNRGGAPRVFSSTTNVL